MGGNETFRPPPKFICWLLLSHPQSGKHFFEKLEANLNKVIDNDLLLLGDFNAKNSEWFNADCTNPNGIALKDLTDHFDLTQLCNYSALEWFANFLQRREQCVQLNGASSKWQIPKSGIPQGTVLGPVLFLIFTNDLPQSTRNQCSIFADDTSLHTAGKSTASSCATLSADLDAAATWADRWGMLFSAPKSKHLSIGNKARQNPPVSMRGVPIPQVRTHKHLGLVLNESLTWSDHISSVYTACARMIGILRRLDGTIRSPAMKRIYTAVIRPRMEYACAVWSGGPTGCLQRLQDSFAKRHSLSLPPLEKRFEYHTLVLFYRVRANLAPTYLSSLVPPLTSTKSGYSFRKESYPVPLTKKSASLNSFLPRAIISWNALPAEVQSSKTLLTFKNRLRAHLSL